MTAISLTESISGFQKLSLSTPLLAAIDEAGYVNPTPIQAALIPYALAGRDVIGQAQTGTGKTAAFALPFLNRWKETNQPGPQALVLVPTRELAVQVAEETRKLSPHDNCHIVPIYGGHPFRQQVRELSQGVNFVVGTPGRILDHLSRGTLSFQNVRYVVLDEADRMLDIGFRDDIEKILRRCPEKRQTLLLSATLPASVLRLASRYQKTPVHIRHKAKTVTVEKIDQRYVTVDEERKLELLDLLLKREQPRQCIIFTETKRKAERLYKQLNVRHNSAAMMHGDLPQIKRDRIMKHVREGKITFLVATDVVGRGIDIENISHIINYDLPRDPDSYVHRIGRTGRMGADGMAISFVKPDQGKELTAIEERINKLITPEIIADFDAFVQRAKTEKPLPPPSHFQKKYSKRL